MITNEDFNNAISTFKTREGRSDFFKLAEGLFHKGMEIEAYLLIIATWNFAIFRYAVKTFDVKNFESELNELKPNFEKFDNEDFRTIEFPNYANDIRTIYEKLSKINGINHTGTPKLMHLRVPKVFVMWDSYIRGEKSMRYYDQLDIAKRGDYKYTFYEKSADSYIKFLNDMKKYSDFTLNDPNKILAKAIDEFNYVNITLPIQEVEKKERDAKKVLKKLRQENVE